MTRCDVLLQTNLHDSIFTSCSCKQNLTKWFAMELKPKSANKCFLKINITLNAFLMYRYCFWQQIFNCYFLPSCCLPYSPAASRTNLLPLVPSYCLSYDPVASCTILLSLVPPCCPFYNLAAPCKILPLFIWSSCLLYHPRTILYNPAPITPCCSSHHSPQRMYPVSSWLKRILHLLLLAYVKSAKSSVILYSDLRVKHLHMFSTGKEHKHY